MGVRGQPRSGKEKRLAAGKSKATPGMRKAMSGRDTLIRGGGPKLPGDRDALGKQPQPQEKGTKRDRDAGGKEQTPQRPSSEGGHPPGQEDERS